MLELKSPVMAQPAAPRSREGPEIMHAFVTRHAPFFVLLGILAGQLLLLSFEITRNHNVRLITLWTVTALDPFERALGGLGDAGAQMWRTYHHLWRAQAENQQLRLELAAARTEIEQVSNQGVENSRLRELLELKARLPFHTVAAEVIARSPGMASEAIYIDKGADAGLATDLAVITPEGVAGKTVAVYPRTAQVLLISDPASGVGCLLEHSRVEGVLKGGGQDRCRVDYVMNDEVVSPGEVVLTSGLDQIYPKGLLLGAIVEAGEGDIYKKLVVKPAARLDRLEDVLVLLKPVSTEQQAMNAAHEP